MIGVKEIAKQLKDDFKSAHNLDAVETKDIVNKVVDQISKNLIEGHSVNFRQLGIFQSSFRDFHSPKKEGVFSRWRVTFKCSKFIKDRINGKK